MFITHTGTRFVVVCKLYATWAGAGARSVNHVTIMRTSGDATV